MGLFKNRRDADLTPFDMQGRHVLVVGMGVSGAAAAGLLADRGAVVTVTDRAILPGASDEIPLLEARGIRFELGGHRPESFTRADMILLIRAS